MSNSIVQKYNVVGPHVIQVFQPFHIGIMDLFYSKSGKNHSQYPLVKVIFPEE